MKSLLQFSGLKVLILSEFVDVILHVLPAVPAGSNDSGGRQMSVGKIVDILEDHKDNFEGEAPHLILKSLENESCMKWI